MSAAATQTPGSAAEPSTIVLAPRLVRRKAKDFLPWWAKIGLKIPLHRVPLSYALWKRIGVFEHGSMDSPAYALAVFQSHFSSLTKLRPSVGAFVALELGPGDTCASAVVARAHGAGHVILVDNGAYADREPRRYQALAAWCRERGLNAPDLSGAHCMADVLSICRASYLTEGLASLRTLPDQSVDLVWSHAVLEHIRRPELPATLNEMRRILRSDGVASHTVDLMDHLSRSLNSLRFSSSVWESPLFANSGFYTNRVRFSEFLSLFAKAGFSTALQQVQRWPYCPIPRSKLAPPFRDMSDDDLTIAGFQVLLRPVAR